MTRVKAWPPLVFLIAATLGAPTPAFAEEAASSIKTTAKEVAGGVKKGAKQGAEIVKKEFLKAKKKLKDAL